MNYRIRIEPSGHEFLAGEGETVLDAALRQGLEIPYGCRNGACGACRGSLLAGEVRYDEPPVALEKQDEEAGTALFCRAEPVTDLVIKVREISTAQEITVKTLPCRVEAMEHLAPDVIRLLLKPPQGERLQFLAGQYIDILLENGARRAFSIANAPHDDKYLELHVRHVPGGRFTDHLFDGMQERELLRIEGPHGAFYLREDSERPIILMGGGTGFGPLKGILEHAFHLGVERPMHLFLGARTRQDLYMHELPLAWGREHGNFRYTPVLSAPLPEDAWDGEAGMVPDSVVRHYPDLSAYDVYMSGPPPMIQAALQRFREHDLDEDRLYYDSFEFSASTTPSR